VPHDRTDLRPVARLTPAPPAEVPALRVGGRADLAFAAVEVIVREGGVVRRRVLGAGALAAERDVPPELIAHLVAPRAPLAGLDLDRPRVMGVVNVTPDSFSDGGRYLSAERAIAHALELVAAGADILDIGGESTRPGAASIDAETELGRVLPVIEALAARTSAPISIDTRSAVVMRRAAAAGARILNDVSALTHDPAALAAAAETGLPVILMHAQGDPRTMQADPRYDDVVLDVYDALEVRVLACERAGIPRERLVVDPGIGFGKTLAHNLALLGSLSILHGLGCPILLGASRKSFIGHLTGADATQRLPGSLAAALLGVAQGVQIVRVHDVAETRQALAVWRTAEG
jgi:dihydropteroate synthase